MLNTKGSGAPESSAIEVLQQSIDWYGDKAKRARTLYFIAETTLLVVAALIPAAASFTADRRIIAALGVIVVVLTGLRQIFRWHENWLRFTEVGVQLATERELYYLRAGDYAGDDRDLNLVRRVRDMVAHETRGWVTLRKSGTESKANN